MHLLFDSPGRRPCPPLSILHQRVPVSPFAPEPELADVESIQRRSSSKISDKVECY